MVTENLDEHTQETELGSTDNYEGDGSSLFETVEKSTESSCCISSLL